MFEEDILMYESSKRKSQLAVVVGKVSANEVVKVLNFAGYNSDYYFYIENSEGKRGYVPEGIPQYQYFFNEKRKDILYRHY